MKYIISFDVDKDSKVFLDVVNFDYDSESNMFSFWRREDIIPGMIVEYSICFSDLHKYTLKISTY